MADADLASACVTPTISAIIACYGDRPAIPIMYERLTGVFARLGVNYEIIFVNDCSPDGAEEVLAELATRDQRVVVINHSRNFGSQAAFSSGMRVATGDAVVLLDGDLQDPPELIEPFFAEWRKGAEVVYGIRIKRETTSFLQVAYRAFYRLFRWLSYIPMPLDAGDFSLMDRRVVDALNRLPETNRFLRGLRAWVGFRQTGVPYVRPERLFGRSTNNLLKNFGWARKAIVSFSFVPLDLIAWLGLLTTLTAFVSCVAQAAARLLCPWVVPSGVSTLIILTLFMGGLQMLSLSVIGSYLAHIYEEVKCRPSFIVDSIWNTPDAKARDADDVVPSQRSAA